MWEKGTDSSLVREELDKARSKDMRFSDGKIFNSMCTTPLPIAHDAHIDFIESNLGNSGLYPGTQDLEKVIISQLGDLMNGACVQGHLVNGGTESNIMALWIARNTTGKKEVVFPQSAHFSFHKACDLLSMRPVSIPLDDGFVMDVDLAEAAINENTAIVIGMAGSTELGLIDPLKELGAMIPEDVFFHVDAAFGGFVIPFLEDLGYRMPLFDFRIPQVTSMTIDPHKMGMSTMPSGAFLTRNLDDADSIATSAPYLTLLKQTTLSGTRCSASVAATYAAMRMLGRQGYRQIVSECMETTQFAMDLAEKLGLKPVVPPTMNVLGLYPPPGRDPRDIQSLLRDKGWMVSVAVNPPCLRMVLMPHLKKHHVESLFMVMEEVLSNDR